MFNFRVFVNNDRITISCLNVTLLEQNKSKSEGFRFCLKFQKSFAFKSVQLWDFAVILFALGRGWTQRRNSLLLINSCICCVFFWQSSCFVGRSWKENCVGTWVPIEISFPWFPGNPNNDDSVPCVSLTKKLLRLKGFLFHAKQWAKRKQPGFRKGKPESREKVKKMEITQRTSLDSAVVLTSCGVISCQCCVQNVRPYHPNKTFGPHLIVLWSLIPITPFSQRTVTRIVKLLPQTLDEMQKACACRSVYSVVVIQNWCVYTHWSWCLHLQAQRHFKNEAQQ